MLAFCLLVFFILFVVSLVFALASKQIVYNDRHQLLSTRGQQLAGELVPFLTIATPQSDSQNAAASKISIRNKPEMQKLLDTFADLFHAELWVADDQGFIFATSNNSSAWLGHLVTEDQAAANEWGRSDKQPYRTSFIHKETTFAVIEPISIGAKNTKANLSTNDIQPVASSSAVLVPKLVMRISVQEALATVNRIWLVLLTTIVVAFLCSLLFAYLLTRQITRPLKEVQSVAERLAAGEYRERVESKQPMTDEIRSLVHAVNTAAEQIEQTFQDKQRLEQTRREFFANVSHEFRAPLTSMQGFLELMIDEKIDVSSQKKYLQLMYEDTQLLTHLVKDLLDLARIESGRIRLEKQWVDPKQLVEHALERVATAAAEKGILLRVQALEEVGQIHIDKQRIMQVILNLLDNAIRHTETGGYVQVIVRQINANADSAEPEAAQQAVRFEVHDNGHGIPAEELPYIWERFYKVDKARTRLIGGTGLGLAIVKQLVELHGGYTEALSQLDEGTVISFVLPVGDQQPE
ncbi:MAG: signal transduction histidine kinase [Bacilli bacterium]|nr:signal transduction histidine kinase [Bacilli bacterium]